MSGVGVAAGLLGLAKDVMAIVSGVKDAKRDKLERAADFFAHLGATLAMIEAEIRSDRVPYGKCGELRQYADHLVEVTEGVIPRDKAECFARLLNDNHDIEGTAIALSDGAEREACLAAIGEASGKFSAMAYILRARG